MRKVFWLIGLASVALILLLTFQMYWIKTSKNLLEEQFTNKVSMALCSAVENLAEQPSCNKAGKEACSVDTKSCNAALNTLVNDSVFMSELNASLQFYQVKLPFEVSVASAVDSLSTGKTSYSCSLAPLIAQDDHWLKVVFKGKESFANKQLTPVWWVSMMLISLIGFLFIYAVHLLIKQQKISKENISFFNHMTHEFSTPLTNIKLATSLINKRTEDDRISAYTGIINKQYEQLKSQIDNVLMMAQISRSPFELNKTDVSPVALVNEVVNNMQLQINDKKAEVRIIGEEEGSTLFADSFHLKNAFRNILDNALKYCQHPKIEIELKKDRGSLIVNFKDNGPGINEIVKLKIFDPYYRCEKDETYSGFGLGLAYVKKVALLHNADIKLMTESMHSGSIFSLTFPTASK
jgi:nitrogen-specific signal transduction histidine kinase